MRFANRFQIGVVGSALLWLSHGCKPAQAQSNETLQNLVSNIATKANNLLKSVA